MSSFLSRVSIKIMGFLCATQKKPIVDARSLTGVLPASPARKGGVEGSYTKMSVFLTGKPRPEGRGGFTFSSPRFSKLPSNYL